MVFMMLFCRLTHDDDDVKAKMKLWQMTELKYTQSTPQYRSLVNGQRTGKILLLMGRLQWRHIFFTPVFIPF